MHWSGGGVGGGELGGGTGGSGGAGGEGGLQPSQPSQLVTYPYVSLPNEQPAEQQV